MAENTGEIESKCSKVIEHFKKELTGLRGGRASSALFEHIAVDYYGTRTPLQSLGLISVPESRSVTIQVYDPGAVEAISKAIMQSDLGINPSREGNMLRINIPALNDERRKALVKQLGKYAEEAKVGVRAVRRESMDAIKKAKADKDLSEDDAKRQSEAIEKIVEKYVAQVETMASQKEKELNEV